VISFNFVFSDGDFVLSCELAESAITIKEGKFVLYVAPFHPALSINMLCHINWYLEYVLLYKMGEWDSHLYL